MAPLTVFTAAIGPADCKFPGSPQAGLWKAGAEQAAWHLAKRSQPEYRFRYLVIYYLTFFSLFVSLFLLRLILIDWGLYESIALIAPIAFVLAMPYCKRRVDIFTTASSCFF